VPSEQPAARARLMSTGRRVLLVLVIGGLVAGCDVLPVPVLNGELIVMDVANLSPRPARLAVAAPGDGSKVVGAVDPAIVPAGRTMKVRFFVPPGGSWAIFANGGELMGDHDVRERRGILPMGIDIGADGSLGWWCKGNCP
jgi:hypothetical protein